MTSRARNKPLQVTVVSNNAETLRSLQVYFDESGVPTHGTRAIADLPTITPATTAVVLFPDDFEGEDVASKIVALRRARPRLLMLVVTRQPHAFEHALAPDGRSRPPLVLPKPSFGWSILDAIRAHADTSSGS
ncbi:MAG: hypothetical protein ACXWUG_00860 [Polyangiales bacterium]